MMIAPRTKKTSPSALEMPVSERPLLETVTSTYSIHFLPYLSTRLPPTSPPILFTAKGMSSSSALTLMRYGCRQDSQCTTSGGSRNPFFLGSGEDLLQAFTSWKVSRRSAEKRGMRRAGGRRENSRHRCLSQCSRVHH